MNSHPSHSQSDGAFGVPPRSESMPYSVPFNSAMSIPEGDGAARGVVLLRESNTVPPMSYTPLSSSNSNQNTFISNSNQFLQPPYYVPTAPAEFSPNRDAGNTKKTWWQKYRWIVVVGAIVVLAAIIIPTAIVVLNKGNDTSGSSSSGSSSGSTASSAPRTTTSSAPGPAATVYPLTLSNGAVLVDPIVRPSNNPGQTYNLTSIQNSVAIFNVTAYEYKVSFARSLSTAERTYPNPPYTYNYCADATVVLCQRETTQVSILPNVYSGGQIKSFSSTAVTVNGTQGLQMTFGAQASVFCNRQVSIILLCSTSTSAVPTFTRFDNTADNAASLCVFNVYFSHKTGCPV
ncbi:hypothetical protein BJ742DRAFT_475640 [Cladochytrium replicatum]|nr:hypothetical protein BJ742DRAFT_475640 [Cladochytrium replicatum]